jgi:outer membrane protein OmpA-like peptidoglycan-associated protein
LKPARADRYAPQAAQRARELLAQATTALATVPPNTAAAARLAAEAETAAREALALTRYLRAARERDATAEDLATAWRDAVEAIAAAADLAGDPNRGPDEAGKAVADSVRELRATATRQAEELNQQALRVAALEDEIRELDARLAGVSSTARDLGERLDARERAQQQFQRVEQAFPAGTATVLRAGDNILIRLQGLAFASGSSRLPTAGQQLLGSLGAAATAYPRARWSVEGHTDASGDSGANQRLSQQRAEAVREFLLNELDLPAGRVAAVGYGDSRPIARNDSAEGRRQNRRIDLVLEPGESSTP